MTILRACLFLSLSIWAAVGAVRAEQLVWPQWETSAVPRLGPRAAGGLLIYLHGRGDIDVARGPILKIVVEMAKAANWDILRFNRLPAVDVESEDERLLHALAEEIAVARREGYRQIVVVGHSRGGWLALSAAKLDGVDGVIGLAPETIGRDGARLGWQRDELARRLAKARAARVVAFFFEGDSGGAARAALQGTKSAFMVIDRPPDLQSPGAAGLGRLVRRYRDCVLQFVRTQPVQEGEARCSHPVGYAVGAEIDFPAPRRPPSLPSFADQALAPYVGRWEGDDDYGGYVIMEAIETKQDYILFLVGQSPSPWTTSPSAWIRKYEFRLDETRTRLVRKFLEEKVVLSATLKSPTELEFEAQRRVETLSGKFLLKRQRAP